MAPDFPVGTETSFDIYEQQIIEQLSFLVVTQNDDDAGDGAFLEARVVRPQDLYRIVEQIRTGKIDGTDAVENGLPGLCQTSPSNQN